jgi:hypothetical protein
VTAARGRRMARSDSTSGTTAPGQDSSRPRRGRASTPAAQTCSKSRNSATRKSASGLPTYGTVSLLLRGLTISPGSPTLHVLHCTVVSHQSVAMGQSRPNYHVRATSAPTPEATEFDAPPSAQRFHQGG